MITSEKNFAKGKITVLIRLLFLLIVTGFFIAPLSAKPVKTWDKKWSDFEDNDYKLFGSEREAKFPINLGPFISIEDWDNYYSLKALWLGVWIFKHNRYPRFNSFRFFPFYYHLTSNIDNREKFLLFPFFYQKKEGLDTLTWTPLSYRFSSPGKEIKLYSYLYFSYTTEVEDHRSLFWLLYWGENRGDKSSYSALVPFFYHDAYERENETFFRVITPVAYHHSRIRDSGPDRSSDILNFSPLHFYSHKSDGDEEATSWGVPLIPFLVYRSESPEEIHQNVFIILDAIWKRGNLDRFWLAPLMFYKRGLKGYMHVLPPFYVNFWDNDGYSYEHLFPIFASRRTPYGKTLITPLYFSSSYSRGSGKEKHEEEMSLSLFHFSSVMRFGGQTINERFFAPLLPIYYSYKDNTGVHRNIAGIFDWYKSADELNRLWIMPFFLFYKKASYLHILPPIFMQFRKGEESTRIILPLLLYTHSDEMSNSFLFLIFWNSNRRDGYSRAIFPIIYHYFQYSKESKSTQTTNITPLSIYNHSKSPETESTSFLSPLLYYSSSKSITENRIQGKKKIINPLFFYSRQVNRENLSGALEKRFWFPIIPIYYYFHSSATGSHHNFLYLLDLKIDNQANLERFWFIPFIFYKADSYLHFFPFYFRTSGYDAPAGRSFGPFYYHRWSENENILWVGPHYSRDSAEKNESLFFIFPFYYAWNYPEHQGNIFLPLYINYEGRQKSVHVNILGGSKSRRTGVVNLKAGRGKTGRWYLDTDYSFLYNLFSFSARISVTPPLKSADENKEKKEPEPVLAFFQDVDEVLIARDQKEEIEKRSGPSITRKRSVNRDNSEFFWGFQLLFGLFSYEQADTKRHLRVLPFWWFTWDTKTDDDIFIIPLPIPIVHYNSPDLEYTVVFPFYGKQRQGASYIQSFFLFLFLREYDARIDQHEYSILWPIINWYSSPTQSGFRFFPIVPLIWHKETHNGSFSTSRTITPLFYNRTIKHSGIFGPIKETLLINPIFYSSTLSSARESITTRFFPIFAPLYYSKSHTKKRLIAHSKDGIFKNITYKETTTTKSDHYSLLGYYKTSETDDKYFTKNLSLLWLFYYNSRKKIEADGTLDGSYSMFIPGLFYRTVHGESVHQNTLLLFDYKSDKKGYLERFWFFPFFFYKPGKDGYMTLFPLFWSYKNSYRDEKAFHILPPLYFSWERPGETTRFVAGLYMYSSENYSRQNFFYLLDFKHDHMRKTDTYNLLLGSIHLRLTPDRVKFQLFYRILMGFEYKNGDDFDFNLLWMRYIQEDKETHFSFIPLWWYSAGPTYRGSKTNETTLIIPPLLSGFNTHSDPKYGNSYFLLGLYIYSSPKYKRQNFLFLVDHKSDLQREVETYNLLFRAVHLEFAPHRTKFHLLYRLIGGFDYHDSNHYNFNILWYIQSRNRDEFHSSLLPIWYYSSNSNSYTLIVPPLLSYASEDPSGVLQLGVLGLLWYRNYDAYSGYDRKLIVLGSIYTEVHRAERGYSANGSLWGVLWQYETESQTGFKKFSILKLPLYKQVRRNGELRSYIMGVNID